MNTTCNILLQLIYDHEQTCPDPFQIGYNDCEQIPDPMALRNAVRTLVERGYITQVRAILRYYCLALTDKGEAYVRNGFCPPHEQSQSTFNFNGATINNAAIGNNNSVGPMNCTNQSSAALSEIQRIIAERPLSEQAALNEMLDILREIQSSQQPVEKSRLARFYELVKKGSDLALPIGQFLFETFFS